MIIYNKTWLSNLQLHNLVADEQQAGCLTPAEVNAVKQKYPVGFYSPGIFIRIGLFILTFIIALFSLGLVTLLFSQANVIDSFGWPLFLGIVVYIALEVMVRSQDHYRSGVDDALLWMSFALITGGYTWLTSTINPVAEHYLSISLFVCLFSHYLTLRFADVLMSAVACASFLAVVYFGWQNIGPFGVATLPFMMMIASAALYLGAGRAAKNIKSVYYTNCLTVVQALSLLSLYLAGNYYIVSELSSQLSTVATAGKSIPLGWFFWGWTILLSMVYVYIGISKKNAMLLRIGLLLVAAAVATFRYYYHVMPAEVALTLGGCIILAAVYGIVKYLKTPKHGITYSDTNTPNLLDNLKIEALITAETFSHAPSAPAENKDTFGGGSFGGGGSSSGY